MYPVRLTWKRPADGVEVVQDEALGARLYFGGDGRVARMRSQKSEPLTCEIQNLEDPIVLRFINCRNDHDRTAFLGRFGFLRRGEVQSLSAFEFEQNLQVSRLPFSSDDPQPILSSLDYYPVSKAGLGTPILL